MLSENVMPKESLKIMSLSALSSCRKMSIRRGITFKVTTCHLVKMTYMISGNFLSVLCFVVCGLLTYPSKFFHMHCEIKTKLATNVSKCS